MGVRTASPPKGMIDDNIRVVQERKLASTGSSKMMNGYVYDASGILMDNAWSLDRLMDCQDSSMDEDSSRWA